MYTIFKIIGSLTFSGNGLLDRGRATPLIGTMTNGGAYSSAYSLSTGLTYCSGIEPGEKEKAWEEWPGFPALRMVNGKYSLPDKPGLGFDLSEGAFKKYPFGGAVPMARVFASDGSVCGW